MSDPLLQVNSITKQFDKTTAVDCLSFQVQRGEIFALLGPNGAGKTTTVRMLMRIIHPDSGTISFFLQPGISAFLKASEHGYLPEDRGLYKEIPIEKTLRYFGVLHGLSHKAAAKAVSFWLERVNLLDRAKEKLDALSKGNQQKIQFIASILHSPKFVILDEPFSGLDPINQDIFLEIIRELRGNGTTILLSAHQMNLVERLADRVLLMNRGREILHGTIPQLLDNHRYSGRVFVRIAQETMAKELASLDPGLRVEKTSTGELAFDIRKEDNLNHFLRSISTQLTIHSIRTEQISLHEVFVQTVQGDGSGQPGEVVQ